MKKLQGKTAVITGCNKGIGLAILKRFAQEGASIVACCRIQTETFESLLREVAVENSVNIYPVYFDLADEAAVKAGMKEIKALKISVDILVNNAGVPHLALLPFTKMQDVHDVFQINYFSQLLIIQSLHSLLSKSETAAIVNIASVAGIDGKIGNTVYGASKASMILLTQVLSKEFAPKIRVNALAPGLTQTDFADQMGDKAKASMIESASLHRLGNVEEIANVALFLVSDESSFITGQVIRVDGGMN